MSCSTTNMADKLQLISTFWLPTHSFTFPRSQIGLALSLTIVAFGTALNGQHSFIQHLETLIETINPTAERARNTKKNIVFKEKDHTDTRGSYCCSECKMSKINEIIQPLGAAAAIKTNRHSQAPIKRTPVKREFNWCDICFTTFGQHNANVRNQRLAMHNVSNTHYRSHLWEKTGRQLTTQKCWRNHLE